jgi:hypothetical protein
VVLAAGAAGVATTGATVVVTAGVSTAGAGVVKAAALTVAAGAVDGVSEPEVTLTWRPKRMIRTV